MTPTEVLNEISKMPLVEKRKLLESLNEEISKSESSGLENREKLFLESLNQKGLLTQTPRQNSDDKIRRNFKRIQIKGDPLSETIVNERG